MVFGTVIVAFFLVDTGEIGNRASFFLLPIPHCELYKMRNVIENFLKSRNSYRNINLLNLGFASRFSVSLILLILIAMDFGNYLLQS